MKNNVKDKSIKDNTVVNILSKFIKKLIDINDKLYKKIIEKKFDKKEIDRLEFYRDNNIFKENYRNYLL